MKKITLFILLIILLGCAPKGIQYKNLDGMWKINEIKNFHKVKLEDLRTQHITFVNHKDLFFPSFKSTPLGDKMFCEWSISGKQQIFIEDCRQNVFTGEYTTQLVDNQLKLIREDSEIILEKVTGDWSNGGYPAKFGNK